MTLADRLNNLGGYGGLPPGRDGRQAVKVPAHTAVPSGRPIERWLPGELVERDGHACFVTETVTSVRDRHGLYTFDALARVSGEALATVARDPELARLVPPSAVFLDTETTGLSLGVGTYVFLVGAGYLADDGFHVKQFFLRGPAQESVFLDVLAAFLQPFSAIITFNGKAFDWPLIESRFALKRRQLPADLLHLDLLHPARRLWKERLPSCALTALESSLLGVRRAEHDVPGWLIPSLYFEYQRSADARPLLPVFYHNLQDVLSLASLTVHIHEVLAQPEVLIEHAADFLSLARVYDAAGCHAEAVRCYQEALHGELSPAQRQRCLRALAAIQKRHGWWESALSSWELLISDGGEPALSALVERAKYYEHVERNYLRAAEDVRQALWLAQLHDWQPEEDGLRRDQLAHRLARVLRRAARTDRVGGKT